MSRLLVARARHAVVDTCFLWRCSDASVKRRQAFRFELDPTKEQANIFGRYAGTARFAYNWGLGRRIELHARNVAGVEKAAAAGTKFEKERTSAITQHRELVELKSSEFAWMREISKCVPQEALRGLNQAFANFFRRIREGHDNPGFPRFKKKGQRDSFRFSVSMPATSNRKGSIRVGARSVVLPRLGKIRTKEPTRKFVGRVTSATVSRVADRWFVSLAVERQRARPWRRHGDPVVGVDLGLTTAATIATADGGFEKVDGPKPLKAALKLLARRNRQHARKAKGSNNRRKSAMKLARLHMKIANRRKDFLHKLTTRLAKTKSVIVVEDLNVEGWKKCRNLARATSDVAPGAFRRLLEYKTLWYGSRLVVANRWYPSSKECSACGVKNESLTLNERQWACAACGTDHDRDVNAGVNLAKQAADLLGLQSAAPATGSSPGSNACREGRSKSHRRETGSRREPLVEAGMATPRERSSGHVCLGIPPKSKRRTGTVLSVPVVGIVS